MVRKCKKLVCRSTCKLCKHWPIHLTYNIFLAISLIVPRARRSEIAIRELPSASHILGLVLEALPFFLECTITIHFTWYRRSVVLCKCFHGNTMCFIIGPMITYVTWPPQSLIANDLPNCVVSWKYYIKHHGCVAINLIKLSVEFFQTSPYNRPPVVPSYWGVKSTLLIGSRSLHIISYVNIAMCF